MQNNCPTGFSCVPERALYDVHTGRTASYKFACNSDQPAAMHHLTHTHTHTHETIILVVTQQYYYSQTEKKC